LTKNLNFDQKPHFGQKYKFWAKTEILVKHPKFFGKNRNFGPKSERLTKNGNLNITSIFGRNFLIFTPNGIRRVGDYQDLIG